MTDAQAELDAWCQAYVGAFNAYDAAAIAAHWTFPALILSAGRSLAFASPAPFNRNTSALLEFYKRQNVKTAVRTLREHMMLDAHTASITVADNMRDSSDVEIVSWQAAYVLQRIDGAWRAAVALADGEVAAWAARGTPLGRG